jgi:hypothetical protein
MPRTDWWHLYIVTFSTFREGGPSASYDVVSDHGPYKAVAIATGVHRAYETWPIFEVDVVDAGVIAGGPGGTAAPPDHHYDDRDEW